MLIRLTDLNGRSQRYDSDTITAIRSVPETLIKFLDGHTVYVREGATDVVGMMTATHRPAGHRRKGV